MGWITLMFWLLVCFAVTGTSASWTGSEVRVWTMSQNRDMGTRRTALALQIWYYNLARIHRSLRITPAMAAAISNHIWTLEELIEN